MAIPTDNCQLKEFEKCRCSGPTKTKANIASRSIRYPDSHFFDAHGTFHLLNTRNTWTARMMRAGGVELSPPDIITAGELMARLRVAIGKKRAFGRP